MTPPRTVPTVRKYMSAILLPPLRALSAIAADSLLLDLTSRQNGQKFRVYLKRVQGRGEAEKNSCRVERLYRRKRYIAEFDESRQRPPRKISTLVGGLMISARHPRYDHDLENCGFKTARTQEFRNGR